MGQSGQTSTSGTELYRYTFHIAWLANEVQMQTSVSQWNAMKTRTRSCAKIDELQNYMMEWSWDEVRAKFEPSVGKVSSNIGPTVIADINIDTGKEWCKHACAHPWTSTVGIDRSTKAKWRVFDQKVFVKTARRASRGTWNCMLSKPVPFDIYFSV